MLRGVTSDASRQTVREWLADACVVASHPSNAVQDAPMTLPESMSRDEALKYYSDYANGQSNEALRYQKRIRDLEAALKAAPIVPSDEQAAHPSVIDVLSSIKFSKSDDRLWITFSTAADKSSGSASVPFDSIAGRVIRNWVDDRDLAIGANTIQKLKAEKVASNAVEAAPAAIDVRDAANDALEQAAILVETHVETSRGDQAENDGRYLARKTQPNNLIGTTYAAGIRALKSPPQTGNAGEAAQGDKS
jgi:hypothetical protein